jgi:hypothetical protein
MQTKLRGCPLELQHGNINWLVPMTMGSAETTAYLADILVC